MVSATINLPFAFVNPFSFARMNDIVTVWINAYRKRNGEPVIADWSAKAFVEYASEKQKETVFEYLRVNPSGTLRQTSDPVWRVRFASQAPASLSGPEARRGDVKAIKKLRGRFTSPRRHMPGWALDAIPLNIMNIFGTVSLRRDQTRDDIKEIFCLPDSSDYTFLLLIQKIQEQIADNVCRYWLSNRNSDIAKQFEPSYVICVDPNRRHKEKMILSLDGEKSFATVHGNCEVTVKPIMYELPKAS